MKQTLTIYFFILSSLFLSSCGDSFSRELFSCELPAPLSSFFENIKKNKIKSVEEARGLVRQGAKVYYKDGCDNTLLHVVSNIELADYFLRLNVGIEARNNKGETPLYTAIQRGYYDVALFLKKKGAYGYAKNNNNVSPSRLATYLILHGNLSPEEVKPLKEIVSLSWEENVHKD